MTLDRTAAAERPTSETGLPNSSGRLAGKAVFITGGSQGIGFQAARVCAREGAVVHISDTTVERASGAVQRIVAEYGSQAYPYGFDVSDSSACKANLVQAYRVDRKLDVLVNNAGIMYSALLGMLSQERLDKLIDVNLKGTLSMLEVASRLMMRNKYGSVINLSSIVALDGNQGQTAYAATKGAVIAITKSAAKELAPHGIRVNAVAPGLIDTDLHEGARDELEAAIVDVPLRRLGKPIEVAEVIGFLASDAASYVTGQVWGIDGGQSL